jgi:predicted MFS family arabinose efflux permease
MEKIPNVAERPTNRWYTLGLLTAIYATHSLDRNVMSVVIEPVKNELQVSDTAMGALVGIGHTAMLAIFILPMGIMADRTNRVRLISAMVVVWSGLTALGATANSYVSLLLVRMGVGAAEAGSPPASISLISDMFSARERPTAISIYYLSAAIGTGLIFLMGGYIAHHYGWRAVFFLAGVPGVLIGIVFFLTVRDPRGEAATRQAGQDRSLGQTFGIFRQLLSLSPLRWATAAGTLATLGQTAVWAWLISFLIRSHGFTIVEGGLIAAAGAGLAKGLGTAVCGPMTRLLAADRPSQLWRYPALVLTLAVPVTWALVTIQGATAAIALVMVLSFLLGGWAGPIMAILVAGVGSDRRGLATSLYQLSTNLIGGMGAMLTGMISDALGGKTGLGTAIGLTIQINLLAALALYQSSRALYLAGADETMD